MEEVERVKTVRDEKSQPEVRTFKLGKSINTLTNRLKKSVIESTWDGNDNLFCKEPLHGTRIIIKTVDSSTDLHREISGTLSVSATVAPGILTGLEFAGSHETTFNALSQYCLIKMTTSTCRYVLNEYSLKQELLNFFGGGIPAPVTVALSTPRTPTAQYVIVPPKDKGEVPEQQMVVGSRHNEIFDKYGNACITSLTYGHEVIFVLELRRTDTQKTDTTKTSVSVDIPGSAKVQGGLSTLIQGIKAEEVINISVYGRGVDESRLNINSLEGLKGFLDSFVSFRETLRTYSGEPEPTPKKGMDEQNPNNQQQEDLQSKGKTKKIKVGKPQEVPLSKDDNSLKGNNIDSDTLLSYETKPFYEIIHSSASGVQGIVYQNARDYDEALLPFKTLSAKIIQCYERVEAYLQLIEVAENHPDEFEIYKNKYSRKDLAKIKDALDVLKNQLNQKLANLYSSPFGQQVDALVKNINEIIENLNSLKSFGLKFTKGLILLGEVTRKNFRRSHYLHHFSVSPEIRSLYFKVKDTATSAAQQLPAPQPPALQPVVPQHAASQPVNVANSPVERFKVLKRVKPLKLMTLCNYTIFKRVESGSYIDLMRFENRKKLEGRPTLSFSGDFTGKKIQVWGKLKSDFNPLMPLSDDQVGFKSACAFAIGEPVGLQGEGVSQNVPLPPVVPKIEVAPPVVEALKKLTRRNAQQIAAGEALEARRREYKRNPTPENKAAVDRAEQYLESLNESARKKREERHKKESEHEVVPLTPMPGMRKQ